jgi:hypothetical protein
MLPANTKLHANFQKFSGGKTPNPQPLGTEPPDLREGEGKKGEKGGKEGDRKGGEWERTWERGIGEVWGRGRREP